MSLKIGGVLMNRQICIFSSQLEKLFFLVLIVIMLLQINELWSQTFTL